MLCYLNFVHSSVYSITMKKKPVYLIAVFSLSHYCVLIRPTNKCSLQCHMIKINQCRAIFTYTTLSIHLNIKIKKKLRQSVIKHFDNKL